MNKKRRVPASLAAVAVLFILIGASAAVDVVVSWARGSTNFNLNVVGLLIGPGLLRLRSGSREFGLVYLWLSMIVAVVVALVMFFGEGPLEFSFFGAKTNDVSKLWVLAAAVVLCLLAVWPIRVLTRSDVRALFRNEPA